MICGGRPGCGRKIIGGRDSVVLVPNFTVLASALHSSRRNDQCSAVLPRYLTQPRLRLLLTMHSSPCLKLVESYNFRLRRGGLGEICLNWDWCFTWNGSGLNDVTGTP